MFNPVPVPDENAEWQMKIEPESCPTCEETLRRARRDYAMLDALQTARYILSGKDVVIDPALRVKRAKVAVDEALRLMQPRRS